MKKTIMLVVLAGSMAYLPNLHAGAMDARVQSVQTHLAPCFQTSGNATDNPVNCEVSGVVRLGDHVILANDKQVPDARASAIFTMQLGNQYTLTGQPTYLDSLKLKQADKYEGLTTTQDGEYVIAITAFNKEGTAEHPAADALNALLYWPAGSPDDAKIVNESIRGNVASSRGLRERIGNAVGSPYYQIEALTTAPGERLLIGVRKYGVSSKAAVFSFLLLSVPFKIEGHEAVIGETVEVVKRISPAQLSEKLGASHPSRPELGLSGIEFDRYNKDRLYATTSFEKGETLGGYLRVMAYDGHHVGEPHPVKLQDGSVLAFNHKPEGVEVLDQDHVLVVHDDDRVRVKDPGTSVQRETHEFVYNIVGFSMP
nr:hypothetical protein [uncultured Pseudomonas sp.]